MLSSEALLVEKLQKIEALFVGATTVGEKLAAAQAIDNIKRRIHDVRLTELPTEWRFPMNNRFEKKLFKALLQRYNIMPYRYKGQKYTTVMAKLHKSFVEQTLWPQFVEMSAVLERYLEEVTDKVIKDALGQEDTEEAVVPEQKNLLN